MRTINKQARIFYEVKTYSSARQNIRAAVGQLLEYALYPDDQYKPKRLVIVSQLDADAEEVAYLVQLNKHVRIPIDFVWFNPHTPDVDRYLKAGVPSNPENA